MGRVVIKPEPDTDLYAVYSENTDGVLFAGTRKAVARWFTVDAERPAEALPPVVEGRLARADAHGSSSHIPLGPEGPAVLYGWRDGQLRIGAGPGAPGMMMRADLLGYCRDLAVDDEAAAAARVEADED
jgi:hypothetical protein